MSLLASRGLSKYHVQYFGTFRPHNLYLKVKSLRVRLEQGDSVPKSFSSMFQFISFLTLKIFSIISLLTRSKPSTIYLKPYLHYFQLDQILMLSTVHTLWFLVNFTIDTFTAADLPTELNIWDPHAPHCSTIQSSLWMFARRNTCTAPREQCGCWWQRWAVMEAVACFCEWHHDKWGASTTNCQSVVSRTSNEGSRTFHNHGEGPY